jgi:hypothetical protein
LSATTDVKPISGFIKQYQPYKRLVFGLMFFALKYQSLGNPSRHYLNSSPLIELPN